MTRVGHAVAILRHNTDLGGDLRLAIREFNALVGESGVCLKDRRELREALGGLHVGAVPALSRNGEFVAVLWRDAPVVGMRRLLQRSAFTQEVIVWDKERSRLGDFEKACGAAGKRVDDLSGAAAVSLAWNYIIESEGALRESRRSGRVQRTISLLIEPFLSSTPSAQSARLRGAKKTTLSLSHDLHIYKAKFFPRMVRALLNIFAGDNQRILDPFCGSGTALLEASLLGFESVGADLDPICQLISRTKVTPFLEPSMLEYALDRFAAALNNAPSYPEGFHFPDELAAKLARRDRIDGTKFLDEIRSEATRLAGALSAAGVREGMESDLLRVLASDAVTKKIRYRFIGVGNGKYTIEIIRQPLLERLAEKIERSRQLACVFPELREELGLRLGSVAVGGGDARSGRSWPKNGERPTIIVTSPPYLPASSGREHYAASRALAFATLGYEPGTCGYYDACGSKPSDDGKNVDLVGVPEADRLMAYLFSDASDSADPQRDAMRFQRKAGPTREYLGDMRVFLENARASLDGASPLLLVVAHHHTFYSHRRNEIEHVVSGRKLYSELGAAGGLDLKEEIEMELLKSAVSRARPRAKDSYYESVLVFQRGKKVARRQGGSLEPVKKMAASAVVGAAG